MNTCDHDHQTTEDVRLLPTGGGGNVIVCRAHFQKEIEFRREMRRTYGEAWADLPTWDSLKLYEGAA